MKTATAVGGVEVTTNYKQFHILEANRQINKGHVQALIVSFEQQPELVTMRPILVNKSLEIIDGQHRFEAAKALGLPVSYMIAEDIDIATAQQLNALQRGWTVMDYARSYSMSGNADYKLFLELHKEYPIALTVLMYYMTGRVLHAMSKTFRRGELKARSKAEITADLERYADFSNFEHWTDYNFGMAVFQVTHHEHYDHERMLDKIEGIGVKKAGSRVDYLRQLEDIYNTDRRAGKETRFF